MKHVVRMEILCPLWETANNHTILNPNLPQTWGGVITLYAICKTPRKITRSELKIDQGMMSVWRLRILGIYWASLILACTEPPIMIAWMCQDPPLGTA